MFLLLENGEIWVIGTSYNPCIVVDIWIMNSISENVNCLAIFEGEFGENQEAPPDYDREDGYVYLIGASKSGQVVLFTTLGSVISRFQVFIYCF
jgi:hypothetical protein